MIDRVRSRLKALRPGQSLVEFTLLLPVLLIMLSGLIEFGFMLNYYLDVIDAARETARFLANDDPIRDPSGTYMDPNPAFYDNGQDLAKQSLKFGSDDRIVWPEFAPDPVDCTAINGDIVLSAFGVLGNPDPFISNSSVDKRFPAGTGDAGVSMCNKYFSKRTIADVNAILLAGPSDMNSGFVLVEIYYEYEWVLGLPWITAFFPEIIGDLDAIGNPIGDDDGKCEAGEACKAPVLYAYSIMPSTAVEPTPTTPP